MSRGIVVLVLSYCQVSDNRYILHQVLIACYLLLYDISCFACSNRLPPAICGDIISLHIRPEDAPICRWEPHLLSFLDLINLFKTSLQPLRFVQRIVD